MSDLRDDLAAYKSGRLSEQSSKRVASLLLSEGVKLEGEIQELSNWLAWAYDKLEKTHNDQREEEWLEALVEYQDMCNQQEEIRNVVIRGS
jgi:hypothetical protein